MALNLPQPGRDWRQWAHALMRALHQQGLDTFIRQVQSIDINLADVTQTANEAKSTADAAEASANVNAGKIAEFSATEVLIDWGAAIPAGWTDAGMAIWATPPGKKWIKRT